jgi:hypothetical protein
MPPKSVQRFSQKIMRSQKTKVRRRFEEKSFRPIASSREVETASREENAAKQQSRASLLIPSKAKMP